MLKVTLEGISWVPGLAPGPLQAPWEAESDPTSGAARPRSWTSVGLRGVGAPSSQAALPWVNLPNLLG